MTLSLLDALPRLTAAYHRGLLVPFLGAGMSRETCPGWNALVEALAKDDGVSTVGFSESADGAPTTGSDQLIRVGSQVIRVLRRDSSTREFSAVRLALCGGTHTPPIQAHASTPARVWWLSMIV
jgi:hypothetical protein